jgi:hypothetical protein
MSKFWGMFEDGDSAEVLIYSLGIEKGEQFNLTCASDMIMEKARDGAASAIRACYNALSRRELVTENKLFCYQFSELKANVTQASASLAFGLRFVDFVVQIPFNVAATGGISDGTSFAAVRGINGINKKIKGIVGKLKKGDVIFYPDDNRPSDQADRRPDDCLDPKLEADAEAKGIKMIPVSTMDEAVEELLKLKSAAENRSEGIIKPVSRSFLPVACTALALIFLCLVLVYEGIFFK